MYAFFSFTDPNENCGSPPVVENGVAVESTTVFAHHLTVEYSCHEYHVLQGLRTVSCLNGRWTTPPICIGTIHEMNTYLP